MTGRKKAGVPFPAGIVLTATAAALVTVRASSALPISPAAFSADTWHARRTPSASASGTAACCALAGPTALL
jgi:hypothetical protein